MTAKETLTAIATKFGATIYKYNEDGDTINACILGSNNKTEKWIELEMDDGELWEGSYDINNSFYSFDELEKLIEKDKEFNATGYRPVKNMYGEFQGWEAEYK